MILNSKDNKVVLNLTSTLLLDTTLCNRTAQHVYYIPPTGHIGLQIIRYRAGILMV